MDNPKTPAETPAGPNASNSARPGESGAEPELGATGIFGVVKAPEPPEPLQRPAAGPAAEPDALGNWSPEAARQQPVPQPMPAPQAFAEPVVHKVVFGGGAAESSAELLDRIRIASAGRAPAADQSPAPDSGGAGSAGFTGLLRTLGSESPTPAPAARVTPAPETRPPAPESGFTSLLRTLNSPEVAATPAEDPMREVQPALPPLPVKPRPAPAAPSPGGFTELMRTSAGGDPVRSSGPGEAPVSERAAGAIPPSFESQPGAFTQLFTTVGGVELNAPASPAVEPETGPSAGSQGSFTRMLSLEPQPAPVEPPYREESKPAAGSLSYDFTPETAERAESGAANRDPFSSSPLPEAQPIQGTPHGSGVGITRLIQMLDEPSRAPAPRMEAAPLSTPPGPEPGVWTQTFASLAESGEPAAPAVPAAKVPDWTPPPAPAGGPGYPDSRQSHSPASLNEPAVNASAAPSGMPGPSEFTRILDASRIRELAMRGGAGAANAVPATPPQSFAPAPAPLPMPNYPLPAAPPVAGMQGLGGMPQPGDFRPPQPPQVPGYPLNYGPHAGAIPAPGGSMPQMHGMVAPPPIPMPQAPPAPPVQPVQPGMGKLQQMVPLLLVLVIVLLVVLLVTVIFLMKH
jgi:hypothetical protein